MSTSCADPPESLTAAEQRFKEFLAKDEYPQTICWVDPNDVLCTSPHEYSVRESKSDEVKCAHQKYAEGLAKGLGIELRAICATDNETFSVIFVPTDDTDAQYHLMGTGLKFSCPTKRICARIVSNPFRWLFLSRRGGGHSKWILE